MELQAILKPYRPSISFYYLNRLPTSLDYFSVVFKAIIKGNVPDIPQHHAQILPASQMHNVQCG